MKRVPFSPFSTGRTVLGFAAIILASTLNLAAQTQSAALLSPSLPTTSLPPAAAVSSSLIAEDETFAPKSTDAAAAGGGQGESTGHVLLHSIGTEIHLGINGIGGDLALPIARKWNVRIGGQYFGYTGHFTSDGAQITADMHLGNGKAGVDWFPFGNGFHISPQVMFAIQTDVYGTVIVPAGQAISLNGADYVSANADPLFGTAHIATRKAAPGLALGWGNISPRGSAHWSFPVEIGFYYIGQPKLDVTFTGSACDPNFPQPLGCDKVTNDVGFQRDLQRFIARNNNNLSYASFFPIAQFGVGYRF